MTVEDALALALQAHRGQVDLDGLPYILHPLRVGLMGRCDSEIIAGFLHDVVEDTDYTLQDLARLGVDKEVTDALALLTHEGSRSYQEYLERILVSDNALALAVKCNDLQDNLSRNDRATEQKKRIYEKHSQALERIRSFQKQF